MSDKFKKIRDLCGYVENGTSQTVKLSQDDATLDWIVQVGSRQYWGPSLSEAIDEAAEDLET